MIRGLLLIAACALGACGQRANAASGAAVGPEARGAPVRPVDHAAPIVLVATHVSTDDQLSYATVMNTRTGGGAYYGVGDRIPAAGVVMKISAARIVVRAPDGDERTLELAALPVMR